MQLTVRVMGVLVSRVIDDRILKSSATEAVAGDSKRFRAGF
jgi:hypothetical protein